LVFKAPSLFAHGISHLFSIFLLLPAAITATQTPSSLLSSAPALLHKSYHSFLQGELWLAHSSDHSTARGTHMSYTTFFEPCDRDQYFYFFGFLACIWRDPGDTVPWPGVPCLFIYLLRPLFVSRSSERVVLSFNEVTWDWRKAFSWCLQWAEPSWLTLLCLGISILFSNLAETLKSQESHAG
jgi:hypothetical protein